MDENDNNERRSTNPHIPSFEGRTAPCASGLGSINWRGITSKGHRLPGLSFADQVPTRFTNCIMFSCSPVEKKE
jgi:hypothetical protein